MNPAPSIQFPPIVEDVAKQLREGERLYLVGGALRDHFLDRESTDFDFVVPQAAIEFARRVADRFKGDFYPLDEERDAGRVLLPNKAGPRFVLDFVAQQGNSIAADLRERDFSINALSLPLFGERELLDPCQGLQDLQQSTLRMCQADSITRDPVRALRAIRLAAQFQLKIEVDTLRAIREIGGQLERTSAERIRDEFLRLLLLPNPAGNLRTLDAVGLLGEIVPELEPLKAMQQSPPHIFNVWEHTLKSLGSLEKILSLLQRDYPTEGAQGLVAGLIVLKLGRFREPLSDLLGTSAVEGRPRWVLLLLAILLHDTGKGLTQEIGDDRIRYPGHEAASAELAKSWLTQMRFSRAEIDAATQVIAAHKRVTEIARDGIQPEPLTVYRYFREMGDLGIDLGLHSLADLMGRWGVELPEEALNQRLDVIRALFEGYFEHFAKVVDPPALLDGHHIISATQMDAGPHVGHILEAIREEQVRGSISTRAEALAFARAQTQG